MTTSQKMSTPHYMRDGLSMRVSHDVTGYPCFYINGMSGEQKSDDKMLASHLRLFRAAPDLLAGAIAILAARNSHATLAAISRLRDAIAKAEGQS